MESAALVAEGKGKWPNRAVAFNASAQTRDMPFLLTVYWPKHITGQADISRARMYTSSKGKSCKSYGNGEGIELTLRKGSG